MSTPTTFGAPNTDNSDWDNTPVQTSPLDDLVAEFAAPIAKVTTVRFELEGRPGWWIEVDTGFRMAKMRPLFAKGDPDPLKLAFAVIDSAATGIGKGSTTVFAADDRPGFARVSPFRTGEIEQALGEHIVTEPGEKTWQAAMRWTLGALGDDRPLMTLAAEIQNAGIEPLRRAGDDSDPLED